MQTYLRYDEASGDLLLVMADLWEGQHETDEFRVVNGDGKPFRRGAEFAGLPAHRDPSGGYYLRRGTYELRFTVEQSATGPTVKTPCRRLASKSGRAKCALCS